MSKEKAPVSSSAFWSSLFSHKHVDVFYIWPLTPEASTCISLQQTIAIVFLTPPTEPHGYMDELLNSNYTAVIATSPQSLQSLFNGARPHTHTHWSARVAGYCWRRENSERLHQSCHQKSTCLLVSCVFVFVCMWVCVFRNEIHLLVCARFYWTVGR